MGGLHGRERSRGREKEIVIRNAIDGQAMQEGEMVVQGRVGLALGGVELREHLLGHTALAAIIEDEYCA